MTGWKGTPGPWEVVDEWQVWGDNNEERATGSDGRGYPIAEVVGPRDWLRRRRPGALPPEEQEANAHGMAAVPQLVEAGLALLNVADRFATEAAEPFGSEAREAMRDALRAAKVLP